ncbi:MAG TPA: DUF6084 family protein [Rhizomicrobium sp.]|jgi:hypothetical protein|nr:DUF6084 family protein [Rhizomicrobium sp.]
MPELNFKIEGVEIERFAAVPTLLFDLHIDADMPIRNITLRTQIRIEPARRGYVCAEHEPLRELFGERRRWGETLRSFLWDHVNIPVAAFERECTVKLPMTCGHDFNVAATKYFHGIQEGGAPLSFLFSGAVFYDDEEARLQIGQISWSKNSNFLLPAATWRDLMALYYPDTTWLRVPNDLFERLYRYKREKGFADWDGALDSLIPLEALERAP